MYAVIVKFMCQPHYTMVPGYEVNHYSSYLCESIFKIRLTFKSVDLIELIAIIMWGKPYLICGLSVFVFKAFNWSDEDHPHYGGSSAFFKVYWSEY